MESISRVTQRIAAIQQRFTSPAHFTKGDFAATFASVRTQSLKPAEGAKTSSEIANMVHAAARRHGVDPQLALAIAQAESGLSPLAVSDAGAVGVMQLMPETANQLGVRNIYDPWDNIDGGVRYLKSMLNMFNGDVIKAVAAYNAGPAAVARYDGIPPYAETKGYVARVMSFYGQSI
ncbi:Lytic transglycosylase, catalytic [Thermosinus carboxydivorans Nor1]|uniref:Lytic transglycosylase, catalytic n=1 Tax=Thermosinus carboxydivorans Nor1 TaxID=401526 RepID=A1HN37_9FIRM|nr:lytic transglycosylase domain-containing protein [Thermosinus carboxydivorans]EAX48664.1 Lytic transglycosylase, catalytic [Thermosinus carboxydivorans Nor1]